jgi:hypothetical protein
MLEASGAGSVILFVRHIDLMLYSRTFWVVLVGGFLIVLVFLSTHTPHQHLRSKADETLQTIKYCEWLQSGSSYLNSSEMSSYLRSNEVAGLSLGQIFFAVQAYPQYLPEGIIENTNIPVTVKTSVMKDAWGRPLHFMWHRDAGSSNVCSALLKKEYSVLVWSSGANGSNEFGGGDDVFVGK